MDKDWVLKRLAKTGRKQVDLARALGIQKSGVTLLLNGKRRLMVDEAAKMADLLGVSLEELAARAVKKRKAA